MNACAVCLRPLWAMDLVLGAIFGSFRWANFPRSFGLGGYMIGMWL